MSLKQGPTLYRSSLDKGIISMNSPYKKEGFYRRIHGYLLCIFWYMFAYIGNYMGRFHGKLGHNKSNVATEDDPSMTYLQCCQIDQ